jgi:hypothetical protein
MKHMIEPCVNCPWSPKVKPGALGGSEPQVFLGQAFGPFILPCHKACDFNDPEWKGKMDTTPQCAGAAMFRANVGMSPMLPAEIHKLPRSSKAFSRPEDFLGHHLSVPVEKAKELLKVYPLVKMVRDQMERTTTKVYPRIIEDTLDKKEV